MCHGQYHLSDLQRSASCHGLHSRCAVACCFPKEKGCQQDCTSPLTGMYHVVSLEHFNHPPAIHTGCCRRCSRRSSTLSARVGACWAATRRCPPRTLRWLRLPALPRSSSLSAPTPSTPSRSRRCGTMQDHGFHCHAVLMWQCTPQLVGRLEGDVSAEDLPELSAVRTLSYHVHHPSGCFPCCATLRGPLGQAWCACMHGQRHSPFVKPL